MDNVPFYKHTEEFRLGQSVSMSRRDKKSGQQHATMRALPKGVEVDIQLDPPFSGECNLSSASKLSCSHSLRPHDSLVLDRLVSTAMQGHMQYVPQPFLTAHVGGCFALLSVSLLLLDLDQSISSLPTLHMPSAAVCPSAGINLQTCRRHLS